MKSQELINQLAAAKKSDPDAFTKEFGQKSPEEVVAAIKRKNDYTKKVHSQKKTDLYKPISLNNLKKLFKKTFEAEYKTELILNDDNTPILDLMCRYFSKDTSFNKSSIPLNIPSLNKGLLIIGSYGCGKTSMMNTFQIIAKNMIPNKYLWFVSISSLELVDEYESLGQHKEPFFNKYKSVKTIYFDDFGTEEEASNYGKKNLLKEILEKRYLNKNKTYLTTNLQLEEIKEKYGPRVFDRLQEQFNIILFPGDSMRK